jgi:hypothetical protein
MDVSNVLAKAWAEVEKAGLPPAMQEAAFREAVQLLSAGPSHPGARQDDDEVPRQQRRTSTAKPKAKSPRAATRKRGSDTASVQNTLPALTEEEFYTKLEDETGVNKDKLEQVLHLDAGIPQISLKPALLGNALKDRMIVIAQLLCVTRAIAFGEDGTSMRVIRAECRRLRSFDEKNINKYLSEVDGLVYVGPSRDKRLKVRPAGERAFPGVIDKLLGEKAVGNDEQS